MAFTLRKFANSASQREFVSAVNELDFQACNAASA